MSALTNGPDIVTCTPYVVVGQDRTGSNKLGPGTPHTYKGVSVQPVGLSEFNSLESPGYVNADYIILKAELPLWVGGPHAIIEWNGGLYDQVGVVKRYGRGRRTRHEQIKIKARGTEVK